MKLEFRCPTCTHAHLVDASTIPEAGCEASCRACGARLAIRRPAAVAASGASAPPPPAAAPTSTAGASAVVVCPRCQLHFVPAASARGSAADRRRVVLIVEDLRYFRDLASDALGARYEVRSATSVASALAELGKGDVDLVLLDLVLDRGEDGLGLLRALPFKPCPILLFTAQDESEIYGEGWEQLRALGADDAVVKGMHMGEMLVRKAAALLGEPEGGTA